jgi:peptidyl-tRNA hydrolase, PTH1 family
VALVLGLGNPGARYAHTRHNVGWQVLERLVARWDARPAPVTATWRAWHAERDGRGVDLVAPLTFMNASGRALEEWRDAHGLDPAALLVVVDDVYLPLGSLRTRMRGSNGGHRGLESLEAVIGTEYARLRIGVGAVEEAAVLREHVLEEFAADEQEVMQETLERAADAVECWWTEGPLATMNRFNRRIRREETET